MHELVREGDVITISAPRNHFPLTPGAEETLLIAGGIGITPLLCMAERLYVLKQPFTLHYCSRSVERTAFRERIQQAGYAAHVQLHLDDGPQQQKLGLPALLRTPRRGVPIYTCGPKGQASQLRSNHPRCGRCLGDLGACARRYPGADLLRARRVWDLSHTRARRRARPSGHVPDAAGAGRERPVPALLFPLQVSLPCSGPLIGKSQQACVWQSSIRSRNPPQARS